MPGKAQKVRIGLFAAVSLALLGVVLVVFGGIHVWERTDRYVIVFDRSVIGLEPGALVYLNGVQVGLVDDIAVAPDDIAEVAVTVELERGTPVRTDTRAVLQYAGITGLKVIDLRGGTRASPALAPGAQIAMGHGLLDRLERQVEAIVDQSAELTARAGAVMQRATTLTDQLIAITRPAEQAATNLAAMTASLTAMVDDNRAAVASSLAALARTANGATALLEGQVAPLVGNAGGLVTDLRRAMSANEAQLRAAMFDLRQASRSFKELANELRKRPSRLLFSNAPPERKLP
jgi:phospholipid/cholesterol/gamma-HCH transport system substrate-binding protein